MSNSVPMPCEPQRVRCAVDESFGSRPVDHLDHAPIAPASLASLPRSVNAVSVRSTYFHSVPKSVVPSLYADESPLGSSVDDMEDHTRDLGDGLLEYEPTPYSPATFDD